MSFCSVSLLYQQDHKFGQNLGHTLFLSHSIEAAVAKLLVAAVAAVVLGVAPPPLLHAPSLVAALELVGLAGAGSFKERVL